MYESPANTCVHSYALFGLDLRSFNAIPSETASHHQHTLGLTMSISETETVPIDGMIIVVQDKDNRDCKFLIPATSTQSGPIVCVHA